MKAIFIPENFNPKTDLEKLNRELKDCIKIDQYFGVFNGTVIITKNYSRKDKLEQIEKKSKENE